MRVLVTGGAGYIGSIIVEELLREGQDVVVVDNLAKGHRAAVVEGAAFAELDLADRGAIAGLLSSHGVEAVVHMAADSLVGESMQQPARYFRSNVVNTLNLVEAMLATGVARLVFSSTAAVYGEPQTMPIQETDLLQPTNVYGETKLMAERMLRWFDEIHGLRFVSLRYFNAAGASQRLGEDHDPETHLIPLVLQVPLGRQPAVRIFGTDYPTPDGTAIRDYIHVVDLAQAHILALRALAESDDRPRTKDEGRRTKDGGRRTEDEGRQGSSAAYNLGNGRGFSVLEVIEAARRVTGHPIPAVAAPRRPGDPARLVASSERIMRELGWRPRFAGIDQIVGSAWEWHRRHPKGYEGSWGS